MQRGEVQVRRVADGRSGRKAYSVVITHCCAKRGEKSCTAVCTCTTPDSDDDVAAPMIEGLHNDCTEAVAGGRHRSRAPARKPLQATDFRHLDHRGLTAAGIRGVDDLTRRPLRID